MTVIPQVILLVKGLCLCLCEYAHHIFATKQPIWFQDQICHFFGSSNAENKLIFMLQVGWFCLGAVGYLDLSTSVLGG